MPLHFRSIDCKSPNATIPSIVSNRSVLDCFLGKTSCINYCMFVAISSVLLLPTYTCVLHQGLQKWRQKVSSSTAVKTSHSDNFAYHVSIMGLLGILGYLAVCCGIIQEQLDLINIGLKVCSFSWYGETCFHLLTCLEHHMAVVHSITYLRLRSEKANAVGGIVIGCVWLFCGGKQTFSLDQSIIADILLLIISFAIASICSFTVLVVLICPGPSDGRRQQVDKSKLRAFYTIVTILATLILRLLWNTCAAYAWAVQREKTDCALILSGCWVNLPSNFVLPLLFLQRLKAQQEQIIARHKTNGLETWVWLCVCTFAASCPTLVYNIDQ